MADVVVYKYADIDAFFKSCAFTNLLRNSLEVNFVKNDSGFAKHLNMLGISIGTVEVQQATRLELLDDIQKVSGDYMKVWLKKLHAHGPGSANEYIDYRVQQRQIDNACMQSTYAQVREMNGEIVEKSKKIVSVAARIKLGATIGIALISGGTGILFLKGATATTAVGGLLIGGGGHPILAFAGVNIAGGFAKSVAQNYESSYGCKAAAIDLTGAISSPAYQNSVQALNSQIGANALDQMNRSRNNIISAWKQIDTYSRQTAQSAVHNLNQAKYKQYEAFRKFDSASTTQGVTKVIGPALNVVFAAKDILGGIRDYREDTKILR